MTREEAIDELKGCIIAEERGKDGKPNGNITCELTREALDMAIKALEQEPRKDEVILTKEEYGELVSSEFDNGYAKGYREALEQEPVLDKIRAEIEEDAIKSVFGTKYIFVNRVNQIIDKYKAEEAETHPINENIAKGFEEFTKMMFRQGHAEGEKDE